MFYSPSILFKFISTILDFCNRNIFKGLYILYYCKVVSKIMKDFILELVKSIKHHPSSSLTFYDDAGDFVYNSLKFLVKVDGFAISRAKYSWCSYKDVGFRAVTAAVSDVIAKGCKPLAYALSIGLTGHSISKLREIINGVTNAISIYGGYLINIDTNSGNDDWIDVFILGDCEFTPIPRVVKPGNVLILPRRIGDTTIAYIAHYNNIYNVSQNIIEVSCRPLAYLHFIDIINKYRSCIAGSIDISDTLAETFYDLMDASGYGILLNASPYSVASYDLINFYYSNKDSYSDIKKLILMANEEYIPILIINSWCVDEIIKSLYSLGFEPIILGYGIISKEITWMGEKIPKIYWDHISSKIIYK